MHESKNRQQEIAIRPDPYRCVSIQEAVMRFDHLVFCSTPMCVCVLVLSGCGGNALIKSSNSATSAGQVPTVLAVAEQVNGVAPNRKQEVQFSIAMDPATVNAQSFQVLDSSGKLAMGIVSYDPDFNTASFFPDPALEVGANYTATINTSAASNDGVHLASPYSYTFSTRSDSDTSPLIVNSVNPAANTTCVSAATAITITFDEAPDASTVLPGNFMVSGPNGAIAVKLSINVATTQVVLTPTSPLPSGNVTVTVNNVADLASVKMVTPYTWSFSTACSGGGGGTNTYVYSGDETEIAGFAISADGSATPVPGSPFAVAGHYLAASPTSNSLFGDGQTGSRMGLTYNTYSVAGDGSLSTASTTTQMANDPRFPSTTPEYVSWIATDRTGTSLYSEQGFGNPHSGDQWIAEYTVGTSGSLSLMTAIAAQGPSPISFTPDNHFGFYTTQSVGFGRREGLLVPAVRNPDGTLSANKNWQPSSPAGAPDYSDPSYALVSPNANYVAVTFFQEFGTETGIAVYPINGDGSAGTPTAYLPLNGGSASWDSTGTYLFVSDAGNIDVLRFDAGANTLSLVDKVPASVGPMEFLNGHLFALGLTTQSLYVFNFANGVLTAAPSSPVSLGFGPSSITALQR
jgi:6-phosphogluconolactonase (cycloisomerase 2 family)